MDEPDDDGPEETTDEDSVEIDVEELRSDPDAAIEAMAHAYALVADLASELARRLEADAAEAETQEAREEAEAALEAVADVLEDAEAVLDVVGSPEDDDEDGDDGGDDAGEDESAPPGEVAGVGWVPRK